MPEDTVQELGLSLSQDRNQIPGQTDRIMSAERLKAVSEDQMQATIHTGKVSNRCQWEEPE